jgi:hypothetical protein
MKPHGHRYDRPECADTVEKLLLIKIAKTLREREFDALYVYRRKTAFTTLSARKLGSLRVLPEPSRVFQQYLPRRVIRCIWSSPQYWRRRQAVIAFLEILGRDMLFGRK